MKIILTLFVFSLLPSVGHSQATNTGPEEQIARVVSSGGYSGTTDKQLSKMGDAAAVVVTKVLGESNLGPQDIENILLVIHLSFAVPLQVETPVDRKPRTTLFLLQSLNFLAKDPGLKQRIAQERQFVLDQFTKSMADAKP